MTNRIYLDYHATTPVDPRVVAELVRATTELIGNAHSVDHSFGDDAEAAVDEARVSVATLVGSQASNVIFTSGATEGANLAMHGFVDAMRRGGRTPRIAVSAIEHRAVLDCARALRQSGRAQVVEVPVDASGHLEIDALRQHAKEGLDLIAVMAANNEVGTLLRIDEVGSIAEESGAEFLCDATQLVGKRSIDIASARASFLVFSAHKLYGPKGVGALVVRSGAPLEPVVYGGGQERGFRPGTLPVPSLTAFGLACRLRMEEMHEDELRVASLRDDLQARLLAGIEGVVVNGDQRARLAGNLHLSVPDIPNGAIIARVRERLAIATGAACSSGVEAPSHVLRAMGLDSGVRDGALRIGLGKFTTTEEVAVAASLLIAATAAARTSRTHAT